jgi:hypothetical protein
MKIRKIKSMIQKLMMRKKKIKSKKKKTKIVCLAIFTEDRFKKIFKITNGKTKIILNDKKF